MPRLSEDDSLIFAKSFTDEDLEMAKMASTCKVPIILDICDNIFVPNYGSLGAPPENFVAMTELASAVVTTGPALESVIRQRVQLLPHLFLVPDGLESVDDAQKLRRDMYPLANIYEGIHWLISRIKKHIAARRFPAVFSVTGKLSERIMRIAKRFASKRRYEKKVDVNRRQVRGGHVATACNSGAPRQVLWFGNHGAPYARFGIADIFDIRAELAKVAKGTPFVLTVVSNNRHAYKKYIEPMPFKTEYYEWYSGLVERLLEDTAVVIIPNSRDEFAICKSANRAVLALSKGVPVVASSTPAMEIFRESCFLDDWVGGIHTYLSNPEVVKAHVSSAKRIIAENFEPERIADAWEAILKTVAKRKMEV